MIDGGPKGIPQPQIQRLTRLVENAVGVDTQRGDSVVVENMKFAGDDSLKDQDSGLLSKVTVDQIVGLLKFLVIAVVGILALKILKPKVAPVGAAQGETLLTAQTPEMLALAQQAAGGEAEATPQLGTHPPSTAPMLDQEIALAQVDGSIKLSALKRIGDAVSASPPEAASVIRQWMNA